jgi:hypothetical protein
VLAENREIELIPLPSELKVRYAVRRHGPMQPMSLGGIPEGLDVIVFIRGVLPERVVQWIPLIQRMGIAVVVDIDDDYERLPTTLLSLYKIQPAQNPTYNWRHVKEACKLADMVTCSTQPLTRYAPHGRVAVLHNAIPRGFLWIGQQHEKERDGLTVGWGGTVYGHPGDLRIPRSGVASALSEAGARFYNVGDGVDVAEDLGLSEDQLAKSGIVPLEQYPHELARLDVAIAPLVLDSYRREAKSALKPMESLALGSAVVGSQSEEYLTLERELDAWCQANGQQSPAVMVPSRGRDWKRAVLRFLNRSEAERRLDAEVARGFIEEQRLMESQAWKWAEAWEKAVKIRRS